MNNHAWTANLSFASLAEAIEASGLVSHDEWPGALTAAGDNPQLLLEGLTERGLLTQFQATALGEGQGASLRVGNYDLLDRLGAGGMGTVYKARHRRMKRIVALKLLSPNLSGNPVFVKRFQREVETIASLGHPNIVMAYDADEAEAGHFLIMEFVSGRDLAAHVEREGPLDVPRAVDYLLQTARGLAYAHAQEIVHRDIKPHNLLLSDEGAIKITDLGLARLSHGAAGAATGGEVTLAGGVIGTADYMPPEQALDSTTIDHRADIYSLGCTLHFLLTGRPPYAGSTIMAILLQHRDGVIPRLSAARPEAPPRLDALFQRLLAKQPEQRIQSMAEVAAELQAIARALPAPGRTNLDVPSPTGASPAAAGVATSVVSPQTTALLSGAPPLSVLIVEPSRVQAAIIKGYLQEHRVQLAGVAASGADAIEAIRQFVPRAVVSAMHLPDLTGLQLAEQIRGEIRTSAPGFVLVTSEDDDVAAARGGLSRVLVLRKPFTPGQLAEALQQVTGASAALQTGGFAPPGGAPARAQQRVLIVDDSATARVRVRTVLRDLGFTQFLEVPDGANAIAVASRECCDLIVTDYNMPLMDGRALVSYLKQNPPTAAIPIIMVTTETDPRLLDPVRRMGVVAIVEKSFPPAVVGPLLDSLF